MRIFTEPRDALRAALASYRSVSTSTYQRVPTYGRMLIRYVPAPSSLT